MTRWILLQIGRRWYEMKRNIDPIAAKGVGQMAIAIMASMPVIFFTLSAQYFYSNNPNFYGMSDMDKSNLFGIFGTYFTILAFMFAYLMYRKGPINGKSSKLGRLMDRKNRQRLLEHD